MTLFYEEEGALKLPFDCQALAREVINGALEYIHCPYEVQVNLLLTMNDEIHEMNRDFRNIDRATDVLSFPMLELSLIHILKRNNTLGKGDVKIWHSTNSGQDLKEETGHIL